MKKSLIICLSLFFFSCAELPEKPDGWLCSLQADRGKLYCNRIRDPKTAKEFEVTDPLFHAAECMDLETFTAYTQYVYDLRKRLVTCENKP